MLSRLILVVFTLLLLSGCNNSGAFVGNQSLDIAQIPLYPDTTIYEGPEEITFDTLIMASKQAFDGQSGSLETQYYWMPEKVKWGHVEQYYEEILTDSGWSADSKGFNTTRWTRNRGDQVLVISAVPIASSGEHILVLMLVSP